MVTNSIVSVAEGSYPPLNIPLTALLEEPTPPPFLVASKSPKSVAFPNVDIVTN